MKTYNVTRAAKILLLTLLASLSFVAQAADTKPVERELVTFSVKPDYRRCAHPYCGGWFLTPVNKRIRGLMSEVEAHTEVSANAVSIYVPKVNYRRLGLSPQQIRELERNMSEGQALLRGYLEPYWSHNTDRRLNVLVADAAWVSPNDNKPVGSYLNMTSSGIVCITTPCPYYEANLINADYTTLVDEISLKEAGLTLEEQALAWRMISNKGLIITGFKFISQGQVGEGLGVAATKVFFSFPFKKAK